MNFEEKLVQLNKKINQKYSEIINIKGSVLLSNKKIRRIQNEIVCLNGEFLEIDDRLTKNSILEKINNGTQTEYLRQLSGIEIIIVKRNMAFSGLTEIKKLLDSLNQQKQFETSTVIALIALIVSFISINKWIRVQGRIVPALLILKVFYLFKNFKIFFKKYIDKKNKKLYIIIVSRYDMWVLK